MLAEIGGIYSFHPIFKTPTVAHVLFDHYKEKLFEFTKPQNGVIYFCDEYISPDECTNVMCTIMQQKCTQVERSKMVLRAAV